MVRAERRRAGTEKEFRVAECMDTKRCSVPDRIVIDKSGANLARLEAVNVILKLTGTRQTIKILQVKYLNNIIEQDHRFIKRITGPMMGFKAFHSACATITGIETAT